MTPSASENPHTLMNNIGIALSLHAKIYVPKGCLEAYKAAYDTAEPMVKDIMVEE